MNIEKINQSIAEFCTAAGFEFGTMKPTPENLAITEKKIMEEVREVIGAADQKEMAKECIDLLYITLSESWKYGHILEQQDIYFLKKANPFHSVSEMTAKAVIKMLEKNEREAAKFQIARLAQMIEKEVNACSFDFQACFDAVQESNMSKFLTSKHDAEIALIKCQNAKDDKGAPKHGMLGIVECGGVYSIKDANSGKVVKEHNFYHKADLSGCVKLK